MYVCRYLTAIQLEEHERSSFSLHVAFCVRSFCEHNNDNNNNNNNNYITKYKEK